MLKLVVWKEGFERVETSLVVPWVCEDLSFELLRDFGNIQD